MRMNVDHNLLENDLLLPVHHYQTTRNISFQNKIKNFLLNIKPFSKHFHYVQYHQVEY
jgi:hypothetical protein